MARELQTPAQRSSRIMSDAQAAILELKRPLLTPEYADSEVLFALFGIKRSLAYQLIAEGLVKSAALKRGENDRGKRLFHVASFREYLESVTEQK